MLRRRAFIELHGLITDRKEDGNETDTSDFIHNFIRRGHIGCDVIYFYRKETKI